MSLEENKQLVRRLIEDVLNTGRTELLSEFFKAGSLLAGSFESNIKIDRTAFPDAHRTLDYIVAEDDKVLAVMTTQGTNTGPLHGGHPPTGKSAVWTSMHLYMIKDGRIVSAVFCSDQLGIRRQLGLLPPDSV